MAAGRLVAALAQAARCVSLNHETIGHSEKAKWTAVGVLDDASKALTLLQDSLRSGSTSVVPSDETVVYARRGLTETISSPARRQVDIRPLAGRRVRQGGRTNDLALLPQDVHSTPVEACRLSRLDSLRKELLRIDQLPSWCGVTRFGGHLATESGQLHSAHFTRSLGWGISDASAFLGEQRPMAVRSDGGDLLS